MSLDRIDREILALLQQDASLSTAEIADRVGLTTTPCWRRIQTLEREGIIRSRVALLDRRKLNLKVTVFVAIRTDQHSADWIKNFAAKVADIPEVVEIHRMSGDVDYLLRIVVPDIEAYDDVYKRLIRVTDLHDVSSSFAMEEIKSTTVLPLDYV